MKEVLNGYVTNPNPTPTLTATLTRTLTKLIKNPKRNNFRNWSNDVMETETDFHIFVGGG
jgi:hypothetical protein